MRSDAAAVAATGRGSGYGPARGSGQRSSDPIGRRPTMRRRTAWPQRASSADGALSGDRAHGGVHFSGAPTDRVWRYSTPPAGTRTSTRAAPRASCAHGSRRWIRGLSALRDALGPVWSRTVVLMATEFGRTAAANGTRGTDHGTGAAAFLLGGAVAGGRVIADWPGLSCRGALSEPRPATDLRSAADHQERAARSSAASSTQSLGSARCSPTAAAIGAACCAAPSARERATERARQCGGGP